MDQFSFRVANKIVGNDAASPGIEITLNGPKLLFHQDCVVAVTGGKTKVEVNQVEVNQWEPINIKSGINWILVNCPLVAELTWPLEAVLMLLNIWVQDQLLH